MDNFRLIITHNQKSKDEEIILRAKAKLNNKNIVVYPEDRVSEFKEKMYILLNIPPYRQHWYILDDDYAIPLYYNISLGGPIQCDIRQLVGEQIFNITVDVRLYEDYENIIVDGKDMFMTIGKLCKLGKAVMYCADLADYIENPGEILQDEQQIKLVYYGFVIKYFPMLSYDAFVEFLSDPKKLEISYPEISPKLSQIVEKYDNEQKILSEYNELLNKSENIKKFALAESTALTAKHDSSAMKVNIRDVTITSKKLVQTHNLRTFKWIYGTALLNLESLFNYIHATKKLPFMRIKTLINNKIVAISKVYEKDIHYSIFKNNLDERIYNTAMFVMQTEDGKYITLIIRNGGYYEVIVNWSEYKNVDFNLINSNVINTINPFITMINSLGRKVFISSERLMLLNVKHILYKNINLTLTYDINLTGSEFSKLETYVKSLRPAGIVKNVPPELMEGFDITEDSFRVILSKGIYEETAELSLQNSYSFMTDANIRTLWNETFLGGKIVKFSQATNSVKISIDNIQENEFNNFYRIIVAMFIKFSSGVTVKQRLTTVKTETNIIAVLKAKDPELFAFNMKGKIKDYSRLSQKSNQPLPYSEEEYTLLPPADKTRAVKFWNFTTNKPIYYLCPNPKNPYINFIVGKHPKNYCLPSCKKINPLDKNGIKRTNKDNIYNACIINHVYTGDEINKEQTRYIVNYGKEVDINRISSLPELLEKWISYNVKDEEPVEQQEPVEKFTMYNDKKYSIKKLRQTTRNNIVRLVSITEIEHALDAKVWQSPNRADIMQSTMDIIKHPKINQSVYADIVNADTGHPIILVAKPISLVEGLLRLAKFYIESAEAVPCKFITEKQIEKSIYTDKEINISSNIKKILKKTIHHPNYYLMGVSQDAGLLNSIALALSKSTEELTTEMSKYVAKMENPISILHTNLEISELILSTGVQDKLLFKIIHIMYKTNVIVIEDKNNKIIVKFPYDINNIEEIFPDQESEYSYILVMNRIKSDYLTSNDLNYYYPIFVITPQEFFKNLAINRKIYVLSDEIIKICKAACVESIKIGKSYNSLTIYNLYNIFKPTKNDYIKNVYVNGNGYCYASLVVIAGEEIIVPLDYSYPEIFEDVNNIVGIHKQTNTDNIKAIAKYMDKIGIYQDKIITDIYTKDDKVMGFKILGLIYEVIVDVKKFSQTMEKYLGYESFVIPIKHSFHEIDLSIYKNGISTPKELEDVDKYIEELNQYELFIIEFMELIDNERNSAIRKRILSIIANATPNNRQDTVNKVKEVADDERLIDLVDEFYKRTITKHELTEIFNNSKYIFDKITIAKIMAIVDGYKLMTTAQQSTTSEELRKLLKTLLKHSKYYSRENADALLNEILNPFRRWYILNASYRINLRSLTSYTKHEDENIYVNIL